MLWTRIVVGASAVILVAMLYWLSTILNSIASVAVAILGFVVEEMAVRPQANRYDSYCRTWNAIYQDADALWHAGESSDWDDRTVSEDFTRIDFRYRLAQNDEIEEQDNELVRKCQREIQAAFESSTTKE